MNGENAPNASIAHKTPDRALQYKRSWTRIYEALGWSDLGPKGVRFQSRVPLPGKRFDWIEMLLPGSLAGCHTEPGESAQSALERLRGQVACISELHRRPRLLLVAEDQRLSVFDVEKGLEPTAAGPLPLSEGDELTEVILAALASEYRDQVATAEDAANKNAARLLNLIHKAFVASNYGVHQTNVLLPRILFLLFADDTGMWAPGAQNWFRDYILNHTKPDGSDTGTALTQLFAVLSTPVNERQTGLPEHLARFPYAGSSLFEEHMVPPLFNTKTRQAVLNACDYDWSSVNPAIFGSLFQQLKTKEERHGAGEHYTSEENIRKLIDPLFLDELVDEMLANWDTPGTPISAKQRKRTSPGTTSDTNAGGLHGLRQRLSAMNFLDPACGCGNILVVSYLKLRELDLEITLRLEALEGHAPWALDGLAEIDIHVRPEQFHGIELNDWSGRLAQTAMLIAHHQANRAYGEAKSHGPAPFPLDDVAKIVYGPQAGNALRVDWATVCPMGDTTRIMGNPPFLGGTSPDMNAEQKADRAAVWGKIPGAGIMDFVASWFLLAARNLEGTQGRAAFVSTNSVAQGTQPPVLWGAMAALGADIDFAHRTFAWANDASGKAAVHCVIIGFSATSKPTYRPLWSYPDARSGGELRLARNINAYLLDAPSVLVTSRSRGPLSKLAPPMDNGSKAADGGHLSKITDRDAASIRERDPIAAQYLRLLVGSDELINGQKRWCLWLTNSTPEHRRISEELRDRAQSVRRMRLASKDATTRKDAARPWLFQRDRQPASSYLAVPCTSSEKRQYVPMAMLPATTIANNALLTIPDATLLTFGLLMSSAFNAWNRTVSGRLKSDCRISAEITYNNFPWPDISDETRAQIEMAARTVLDVRTKHPEKTLAYLYGPATMPDDLKAAHQALDGVVLAAYGLRADVDEARLLTLLFGMYATQLQQSLTPPPAKPTTKTSKRR